MQKHNIIAVILFFLSLGLYAQTENIKLNWQESFEKIDGKNQSWFSEAIFDEDFANLPIYYSVLSNVSPESDLALNPLKSESLTRTYFSEPQKSLISGEFQIISENFTSRGVKKIAYKVLPIRRKADGTYEKLISYSLKINKKNISNSSVSPARTYNSSSVLADGAFYKFIIPQNGIFKIDKDFLESLGINVNSVNPKNLRVYGNTGGLLPQSNAVPIIDDLTSIPLFVSGAEDGKFDKNDYALFYGRGASQWKPANSSTRFDFQEHFYDKENFYFLTFDKGPSTGMQLADFSNSSATKTITQFNDFLNHEVDKFNEVKKDVKSGREWYGEELSFQTTQSFDFNFPNRVNTPIIIRSAVLGRASSSSTFDVKINGQQAYQHSTGSVDYNYLEDFGRISGKTEEVTTTGNNIQVSITFNKPNNSAQAWLDYIEVNALRELVFTGNQLHFRSLESIGPNEISKFQIRNISNPTVWDVTNPVNPTKIQGTQNGTTFEFNYPTNELKEFVAYQGNDFSKPSPAGRISNQNLHGMPQVDMVIVTHANFLSQAKELAAHKRAFDNLRVSVATTDEVFNEFSSGMRDVSAIRNFMKMFYDRAQGNQAEMPKYLLLFGDGSYDNKNRILGNTNFVPTYQSVNSLKPTSSYVSDDYFGLLDDDEGDWEVSAAGGLDISIGRLPVTTSAQASMLVQKIKSYTQAKSFGDWRNKLTLIADDEDNNLHLRQVEELADTIKNKNGTINIEKIYLDAYKQESTPGGSRYPEVTRAINQSIQKGTLILNYTGHGGEVGLAHERILGVEDINSWSNADKLAMIFTATCSFSRFDDPERTSAGELALLNPNGGAIALFTTVRLVYAGENFRLNKAFYEALLDEDLPEVPTLGDLFMFTKNKIGLSVNSRNFTLLGDPSLQISFPKLKVETTTINGKPISSTQDTLKALSFATLKGVVKNRNNQKATDFNGILDITIFDKKTEATTLGNDSKSYSQKFEVLRSTIYKGKATVTNGDFQVEFLVPKDISYVPGNARISYYVYNEETDGGGSFEDFAVGGASDTLFEDSQGPDLNLFMNDEKFVFGGIVNDEPLLLVNLKDLSGINTSGNGIGHDLIGTLYKDGIEIDRYVLNEFYEGALDSYSSGQVTFPLPKLEDGEYSISVKAWDGVNNSAEGSTTFKVIPSNQFVIDKVFNYPNPFTTNTSFQFEHNRPGTNLDIQIQIFSMSGRLIKVLEQNIYSTGSRVSDLNWNGLDDFGDQIGKGVYVYRVMVRTPNGLTAEKFEKLVTLR